MNALICCIVFCFLSKVWSSEGPFNRGLLNFVVNCVVYMYVCIVCSINANSINRGHEYVKIITDAPISPSRSIRVLFAIRPPVWRGIIELKCSLQRLQI